MTDFKVFHRLRVHVEVISTTVTDLSDLPVLVIGENIGKKRQNRLSIVFMGLKNNFNLNTKS